MPESVSLPLEGRITNQSQLERQVANIAKKAGKNLNVNLGTNAKDIKSLEQPLGRITGQADDFGKSMEAANARVIAFGASVGIINAVVQSFKSLVTTTIEVEKSLAKINSILKTSTSGLNSLKNEIFDIARSTEQTFDTVADAALELSRQGLSATEVTKRLNDALILSRLSGLNAAESVAGLTAAVNSFTKAGLTTGEVLNKISNAANQFAVSERDLIEGFKRSASVAEQAGVSIDELGGIITAVQQKTARGGAVIGNSFKTIFTRIGRADNLELLRSVGVEVTDLQGKILPATKLIENLAKQLGGLNDVQVRSITEKIGGGFQIAPLLAALSDYSSETSIAIQATEAFRSATDQAYQKNIILNQTLSAAINSTSLSIKQLANSLGELGVLDPFKEILNSINDFTQKVNEYLGDGEAFGSTFAKGILKGISGILIKGGIAIFGLLLFNLSKNLLKFGADSFKAFLGLNKEAEKLKSIQAQIVQTLLGDKGVRNAILKIENSSVSVEQKRLQQAEFFNTALRERVKITSQLNTISAGVSPGIIATGSSRATKRSAGGFLPIGAEQNDINSGVGGAPSSAKPVVIPNFAFGNGKKGTMVANSSEYIVPNFAGGGSAIFNQDMVKSMGLPSGAKKVNAAGGFVPNFKRTPSFPSGGIKGIEDANRSKFFKADGGYTSTTLRDFVKENPNDPKAKAILAKKNEGVGAVGTYNADRKKPKSIMLTPESTGRVTGGLNTFFTKNRTTGDGKKVSQFLGSFAGVNQNLDENSRFAKLLDLEDILDENLTESVNQTLSSFGNILPRDPTRLSSKQTKDLFFKEGGAGAYGAFKGAIFEGVIDSITGGIKKSSKTGTLDVDFGSGEQRASLEEIFGVKGKGYDFGDFKSSSTKGNQDSFINQILQNLPKQLEKSTRVKKGKASTGYIPNFAQGMSPVEEAIQREKDAGVPINQIRINQDGKLRNSQNPSGIAVTNTRDEPTGAIPKNASRGFVPNFIGPGAGVTQAAKANVGALKQQTESLKKSSKVTQGEAAQRESSTNKMILLTSAAFGLQQVFGGLGSTTDGLSSKMAAFGEGITAAIFTASALSSVGAGPENIIGGIGGSRRGRSNLGRSAKKSTLDFAKGLKGRSFIGPLSKSFTKLAPIIGKVVGFGARLVPILGTAITAFQLLNPILKSFGIDIGKFLFSPLKSLGQKLGFVDTEAEKAAKSINKFSEKALDNIFTAGGQRNLFREESKQFKNPEGKVLETANDILKSVLSSRSAGREDSASFFRIEKRRPVRNQQFQEQGGVKKYFSRIQGEEIEISKKTFDSLRELGPSINKKVETALLKTLSDVDLKDLENNPTFEKIQFLLDKQIGFLGEGGREKLRAAQQRLELAQAQVDKAQPKKGSRGRKGVQTAEQAASEVDGNAKVASAKEEIAKLLEEILKGSKALSKQEVIANNIKKIKFDIAKIEAESFVNQKLILTNVKTQEEAELSYRNALKETASFQRFNNTTRLKEIETERKIQQESLKSIQKDLGSDKFLTRVFQKNALGEIPVDQLRGYLATVNEISEASAKNKDINTEDYALQLARIAKNESLAGEIKTTLDANQRLLKVKRDELSLTAAMNEIERGRSKFSEIEVRQEQAKLSLIQQQFDIEQKRISNAKTLSDLAFDIELEDARAAAIGGGQSSKLSLAATERDIGQRRIDANEKFDTDALTKSFEKSIVDIFSKAGFNLNGDQRTLLRESGSADQFESNINDFNEAFKKQQALEIEAAAELQRKNQEILYKREVANLNFQFTTEDFDTSVRDFSSSISRFADIVTNPVQFLRNLTGGDSTEEQGGNQNQAAPSSANSAISDSNREAERARLRKELQTQRDSVIKDINDKAQELKDGITGVTVDVQSFRDGIETIEQGVTLAGKRLQNAFDETGASATTFSNLLRDVFNKIPEQKAQNLFDIATTADPDTLQRAALDQARIGVLENSEGSLAERNKQASEYILLKEKEIALVSASDTATRIQLEYEYQINLEILALRQEIAEAGNTEEAAELAKEIERLKDKKNNPDPGTKLKKLSIDGETASERMIDAAIEGANQFINTISDGLVDAISKGESLGDVLRGAADDFLDKMAKQAVNNVIRQGLGVITGAFTGGAGPGNFAEGGMISGGSGMKDDVPAMLMGGEYVMKKTAVQKYGPNFMNQLNNGSLPGYAEGGMVGQKPINDYQSYRMGINEADRTQSGVLASDWTPKASKPKDEDSEKSIEQEDRTDSGIIASKWTVAAGIKKARKKEIEEKVKLRAESGVESSDWTRVSNVSERPKKQSNLNYKDTEDVRTKSGIVASDWTPEANYFKAYKPEERLKNDEIRSDSGRFSSRWTDSIDYIKEKKEIIDKNVKFRAESGLQASEATPKANLNNSFDPSISGQETTASKLKASSDLVPSMLTSGEYVVGKKAAEKFGKGFLDSLNEGKVKKFQNGGLVSGAIFAQEEEDFKTTNIFGDKIQEGSLRAQKGGGDFVIPGLYGQGNITGGQNLLDFSTQAFTSGSRDVVGGVAGASVISLEPESIRLTNYGRTRETPLQAATREAKGQAFDLNLEYQQQVADYKQLLEDLKEQEKARKKAIITKALISIAGMGISAGLSGLGAAMGSNGTVSLGQGILRGAPNSEGVQIGGILNPGSYGGYNLGGQKRATGGYINGGSSDVDSVMAMLSGGEFVLNKAATERIGQENLQSLNSGGDTQNSEKIVDKLEELLLATRENSGEINITVNGGGSNNSNQQNQQQETVENKGDTGDARAREELGKAIKLKVLEVLREEKRLGGTLR